MPGPSIVIAPIELLALKKLALICNALGQSLKNASAANEQRTLTKVLVDVIARADLANAPATAITRETSHDHRRP